MLVTALQRTGAGQALLNPSSLITSCSPLLLLFLPPCLITRTYRRDMAVKSGEKIRLHLDETTQHGAGGGDVRGREGSRRYNPQHALMFELKTVICVSSPPCCMKRPGQVKPMTPADRLSVARLSAHAATHSSSSRLKTCAHPHSSSPSSHSPNAVHPTHQKQTTKNDKPPLPNALSVIFWRTLRLVSLTCCV